MKQKFRKSIVAIVLTAFMLAGLFPTAAINIKAEGTEEPQEIEATEAIEITEGIETTEGTEIAEGIETTEGTETTEGIETTEGTETTEGSEITEGSETTEDTETAEEITAVVEETILYASSWDDLTLFSVFIGLEENEDGEVVHYDELGNQDNSGDKINDCSSIYVGDLFEGTVTTNEGYASLIDYPYWKNSAGHEGKLELGNSTDWNLWYEKDDDNEKIGVLHIKNLNLIVNGDDDNWAAAIGSNVDLELDVDGDNIICGNCAGICVTQDLIMSGSGSLEVSLGDVDGEQEWNPVVHVGGNVKNYVQDGEVAFCNGGLYFNTENGQKFHDITGTGEFADWSLPGIYPAEDDSEDSEEDALKFYSDGAEQTGYSGCYLTQEQFENNLRFWQEWEGNVSGIYFVHGSTIQEVIDKLDGKIPVTFYDDQNNPTNITANDVNTGYIQIESSATNYDIESEKGVYVTSTRSFEGIRFGGTSQQQLTNHENPADGPAIEDSVYRFEDETILKDYILYLCANHGLTLQPGFDIADLEDIEYVSNYNGGLYVAKKRESIDAEHQQWYDLGDCICTKDNLLDAVIDSNNYVENSVAADDVWRYISEIYYDTDEGWFQIGNYELRIEMPLPGLHINSSCDFVIEGDFNGAVEGDVQVYFGFLPDTDHTITFVYDDLEGNQIITSCSKEDLESGKIRGKIQVWLYNIYKEEAFMIDVLMYQHITAPSVSGDYTGDKAIDNIPDGKILAGADITEEQLEILEKGGAVDVDLSVNNMDVTTTDGAEAKKDIEKEISDLKMSCDSPLYLELNLHAFIKDASGNNVNFKNKQYLDLSELEEGVSITLKLPDDFVLKNNTKTFTVIRHHVGSDGNVTEPIKATYDEKTKTITFVSDKFSSYAIVYDNAQAGEAEVVTPGKNTVTNGPKTGDDTLVKQVFVIMLLSLFAGSVIVVCNIKKKRK